MSVNISDNESSWNSSLQTMVVVLWQSANEYEGSIASRAIQFGAVDSKIDASFHAFFTILWLARCPGLWVNWCFIMPYNVTRSSSNICSSSPDILLIFWKLIIKYDVNFPIWYSLTNNNHITVHKFKIKTNLIHDPKVTLLGCLIPQQFLA